MNIDGISKLSKERLLDELRKMINLKSLIKLSKDKISLEFIKIIFPELKYFNIFTKINSYLYEILQEVDFIFLISLLIIDETDNADYFIYKFNISKKDQKRIKNIDEFYKEKLTLKTFNENNLNSIFYYKGKEALIDILYFKLFKSKKFDNHLIELTKLFKEKSIPIMPIKADILMSKYKIPEGKILGNKLKLIEDIWVKNNFKISDNEVDNIINN